MSAAPQFFTPRCDRCESMIVNVGALCVACDEDSHYGSPNRTSPIVKPSVQFAFDLGESSGDAHASAI